MRSRALSHGQEEQQSSAAVHVQRHALRHDSEARDVEEDLQEVEPLRVRREAELPAAVPNARGVEAAGPHLLADQHPLLHGNER